MNEGAAPIQGGRGPELLLRHCTALTSVERPSAYRRLEHLVGDDLARMLVAALTGNPRDRLAA
jgi:hypothetical protein